MKEMVEELSINSLELVNGGLSEASFKGQKTVVHHCPTCQKDTLFIVFSGGRAKCSVCSEQVVL